MSRYIKFDDAVKVMACEMYAEAQSQGYEVDSIEDFMPEAKTWMNDAPSVDTDLSGYSDRLWKNAYERGKADRPQGKWIYQFRDSENEEYKCSECDYPTAAKHNYCPNCGADMREREGE